MRRIITCSCLLALASCKPVPKPTELKGEGGTFGASTKLGSTEWYKGQIDSADKGEMFAQLRIADCFYIGSCGFSKNESRAMHYWELAADQGSIFAQEQLARGYQFGISGLPKDLKEAAQWWRRAAESGDPGAADILGAFYEEGDGVPQNFDEAAKWYRRGADGGDSGAQRSMGEIYVKGTGVPRDYERAHMWLNLACSNGEMEACKLREGLAAKMSAEQIARAQSMASQWKPTSKRVDKGKQ